MYYVKSDANCIYDVILVELQMKKKILFAIANVKDELIVNYVLKWQLAMMQIKLPT